MIKNAKKDFEKEIKLLADFDVLYISTLQRYLDMGYNKANKFMQKMLEQNICKSLDSGYKIIDKEKFVSFAQMKLYDTKI